MIWWFFLPSELGDWKTTPCLIWQPSPVGGLWRRPRCRPARRSWTATTSWEKRVALSAGTFLNNNSSYISSTSGSVNDGTVVVEHYASPMISILPHSGRIWNSTKRILLSSLLGFYPEGHFNTETFSLPNREGGQFDTFHSSLSCGEIQTRSS